ncbi:hypothetical protein SAMN04488034_1176 [Salinimicrobium catena]|uniref:Uncharacterized protein n=1 Tax=Salinimicrobium catena TaxID=390640 RepID=A0A1H5PG85_9FLAO|nr:hypothetical protein [Salinimicrobium catena]SDL84287.1 hypothetical protein SAMN04488140_1176 [Salinimicrobium catena]SEF12932.1 hypothetical protein SAMN04488034_1176 [Salinimicrobium catena]
MMKKILLLTLIVLIFACKNSESEISNNQIEKEFYADGKYDYKLTFHKNEFDSIVYKYPDGKIYKTGKIKNQNKIGNWLIYDSLNDLREIREYFIVNDSSYLNRVFHLKNGDTLANKKSLITHQPEFIADTLNFNYTTYNFIKVLSKDTINLNEPFSAYAYNGSPTLRNLNSQILVLVGKEKNNINSDFSNLEEVKLDTFYNVNTDAINQPNFTGYDWKQVAVFGRWFKTPGEKTIRGYVLEYAKGPFTDTILNKNNVDSLTTKTYFERKVFIRER